ncbi:hypothetical protein NC653_040335 [Populus alba x Populus x berolinensis]|uniref:Uncharacterized protein n=2 Tax=Populus TaxID=3689 RepID=A0A4U5PTY4_POPAL|nr:hypothetical protein NC653_040335 [Populus alba x Populus x berolinensis]TKS00780.1 hypothetical protein D5086_0000179240 [Populus alba]
MAKLVEEARNSKSKTRRFIDKFAQYYTPGKIKAMAFDKTSTLTDFQQLCAKISAYTHCFIGKDYVYNSSIMASLIYSSLASNVYSSFSGYQASRLNQVIQWQLRYSRLWKLDHALEVVHAELLPEGKATTIKELKKEGPTAMIGDGLNDAPALAIADIGISKGISGSAPAIDTGHVILMSIDLRKVPKAIRLACKAPWKVIENVIMSMSTKSAILALAFAGHPLVWAAFLADLVTVVLSKKSRRCGSGLQTQAVPQVVALTVLLPKVEKAHSGAQNSSYASGCSTQKVDKVLLEAQTQGALQNVALARKLRRCRVGFKIQLAVPQDVATARKL